MSSYQPAIQYKKKKYFIKIIPLLILIILPIIVFIGLGIYNYSTDNRGQALKGAPCNAREYISSIPLPQLTYNAQGQPFTSRAQLDQKERQVYLQSMPELGSLQLPPQTKAVADQIRQIREKPEHFTLVCGTKRARALEIVISQSALNAINSNPEFGGNVQEYLRAHVIWLNYSIAKADKPEIRYFFVLKRVMVVSDAVVSGPQPGQCDTNTGQGWQVCNKTSYSWWANDRLNGVEGDIPYDIDSRWVLGDHWANHVLEWDNPRKLPYNLQPQKTFAMDDALNHELLHHLCIGDLYWYSSPKFLRDVGNANPARSIKFEQPLFNDNDNFGTSPGNIYLSSYSSSAHNYCMINNPKLKRSAQHGNNIFVGDNTMPADGYADPYTATQSNFTLKLNFQEAVQASTNTRNFVIEGCSVAHPQPLPGSGAGDKVVDSTTVFPVFQNNSCILTLTSADMDRLWPIFYINVKVRTANNVQMDFPIPFQRPLLNSLKWGNANDITIHANKEFWNVFYYVYDEFNNHPSDQVVLIQKDYKSYVSDYRYDPALLHDLGIFAQGNFPGVRDSWFYWQLEYDTDHTMMKGDEEEFGGRSTPKEIFPHYSETPAMFRGKQESILQLSK